MNLLWHKWRDVLEAVAATQNLDDDLGQVQAPQARRFALAVNAALEIAWKRAAWPGCCWVMRELTTPEGETLFPYLERGYNVLALYSEDPLAAWEAGTDPVMVPVRETSGTLVPQGDDPETPFYFVRLAPPRFGIAARSAATAYKPGDLAYDPATGEAWRCVIAHTNTAFPTWDEWYLRGEWTPAETWVRRNGVLWNPLDSDAAEVTNEPTLGADWDSQWETTAHVWAPQRVPDFLLQAVIHGARAWLHESPPLPRSALEKQMDGWLDAEVDDIKHHRRQGTARGGSVMIL